MEQVLESQTGALKLPEAEPTSTGAGDRGKVAPTRRAGKSKASQKKDTPPIVDASAAIEILQAALNFCSQSGYAVTATNIETGPAPSIGILVAGAWFCVKCQQFKPLPAKDGYDCGCANEKLE